VVYGRKTSVLDKGPKSIRFYNMFGELLNYHVNLTALDGCFFRPRPKDTLKHQQLKKLKKDYKKKYEKMFKDEEQHEKKLQSDIVKDKKKKIRDDFLNNFFIPLRQDFEKDVKKFQALFPIKEDDMSKDELKYTNIYQFGETISQRKLENQ